MRKIGCNVSEFVAKTQLSAQVPSDLSFCSQNALAEGGEEGEGREQSESRLRFKRETSESKKRADSQVQFEPIDSLKREHFLKTIYDLENEPKNGHEKGKNSEIQERYEKCSHLSHPPEMPTDQCVRWCWKDKQPYMVVGAVGEGAYRIKRVGKEHAESTVVSKVIWDTQFVEGVKA